MAGCDKTVAIVQSNYIPWKGYFDLINTVNEFILYDDAQYTKRDWRNRNLIKTRNGLRWLTIPVSVKGKSSQRIIDTTIADAQWAKKHWAAIVHNYSRAVWFSQYKDYFESLYLNSREKFLSEVNHRFITGICKLLGIKTKISWSNDYDSIGRKSERLVCLCQRTGATQYISGPTAKNYLDEDLFRREGIAIRYIDYEGYPQYRQLHPPFQHAVSIVDLIMNKGAAATLYMKSFGDVTFNR